MRGKPAGDGEVGVMLLQMGEAAAAKEGVGKDGGLGEARVNDEGVGAGAVQLELAARAVGDDE